MDVISNVAGQMAYSYVISNTSSQCHSLDVFSHIKYSIFVILKFDSRVC